MHLDADGTIHWPIMHDEYAYSQKLAQAVLQAGEAEQPLFRRRAMLITSLLLPAKPFVHSHLSEHLLFEYT